jgi:RNA recognition motif-containing protein
MKSRVYVGNISFKTTENDLQTLFSDFGTVKSVKIVTDRDTGRSRGFGFVEMEDENQANSAVESLDGKENNGRTLKVNIAKEDTRPSGGAGGGPRGPRRDFNGPRGGGGGGFGGPRGGGGGGGSRGGYGGGGGNRSGGGGFRHHDDD